MKKIKCRLLEPKYETIILDDIEFKIDLNRKDTYKGYTPIMAVKNVNSDEHILFTAVLDENLKPVVPLRKEKVTTKQLENNEFNYDVMIFDNDKAVYINEDYCYLINLKDVEFEKTGEKYIPKNYILKFRALYNDGTNVIVVYNENTSFLYNVNEEKKESKVYDYIKPTKKQGVFLAYYLVKNKYFYPLFAELEIEKENKIHNKVLLNENTVLYPGEDILKNKSKLVKYCDSAYNNFAQEKEDKKCKRLIQ